MWKKHQQVDQKFTEYPDKHCLESPGDSGFISSDCTDNFKFSSNFLSEEILSEPTQSHKAVDNDNFELNKSFNQLSLKNMSLNQLDSNKLATQYDSGISMTSSSYNVEKSQSYKESWQLYYTQNDEGDTLLHIAIIQGFLEATFKLINIAPDLRLLDILNDDNLTALHLAVLTDQPKIVRRLVLAGANLGIRNSQGNTALHLACIYNKLDCAVALLEPISMHDKSFFSTKFVPQNLEHRNYCGETALHIAAIKNHVNLVKLLVQHNADINSQETLSGKTALHLALERACIEVFYYLIYECRPNLNATTYAGYTVYQIARCVNENLVNYLVRLGATPVQDECIES